MIVHDGYGHEDRVRQETRGAAAQAEVRWRRRATWSVGLLVAYWLIVLLLDDSLFGVRVRLGYVLLMSLAVTVTIWWLMGAFLKRQRISVHGVTNFTVVMLSVLFISLVTDLGSRVYRSWRTVGRTINPYQAFYRETDSSLWMQEFNPREYYPTDQNFRIMKPRVSSTGWVHGPHYSPLLKAELPHSETVFPLRRMSFTIDEYGFRETTPINQARIFTLGDSFTFGYGVEQQESWPERVEQHTGSPVYNLGIGHTSPGQQAALLKYVLDTYAGQLHIEHLVWMLFEGNDLEESYESMRPITVQHDSLIHSLVGGTLLGYLLDLPYIIQAQSVVYRFRKGDPLAGVPVGPTRLYYSQQHGYKLFYEPQLRCTDKSLKYIQNHPNRPRLEQSFRDVAVLAQQYQFAVTVSVIPCEDRIYAKYFQDFPPVHEGPHFIDFVLQLARKNGFQTINLLPVLEDAAQDSELLYARDDPHWTPHGNDLVGGTVAARLRGSLTHQQSLMYEKSYGE